MDLSTLTLLDGASTRQLISQAYSRLETIADFHDIVALAMAGVDVAFELVPGSLSGFLKPLPIDTAVVFIRRISEAHAGEKIVRTGGTVWTISITDTPRSVAAAVKALLKSKATATALHIDLTPIGQGPRSILFQTVFAGIIRCLCQRAGRLLTATDIADLMGWIGQLTESRIDAQLRYGQPEWGAFVRWEQADLDRAWTYPPRVANVTRSLVCAVPPSAQDLRTIIAIGKPIGIINAVTLRKRAPWAAGLSADKTIALGNACLAQVVAYSPPPSIVESEGPTIPLTPGRHPWGNVEARYQPTWNDLRTVSAAAYADVVTAIPAGLQDVWTEQAEALRSYSVRVEPVVGEIGDLARHALDGGIKAARTASGLAPKAVLSAGPIDNIPDALSNSHSLIGHPRAAQVQISADGASGLLTAWDGLTAIDITPAPAGA